VRDSNVWMQGRHVRVHVGYKKEGILKKTYNVFFRVKGIFGILYLKRLK
jgi:hypothetical protein